ncbi:tannase/feruloyl esterase family alpha/beta hydrolase [Rahnella sp. PD12R]|uniref:tannase/feruloyl esterase family alpha/beta hydrolase n=1 Tax=Rahnella sp. PD12R TaxID=2855688 RepID=UPI001C45CF8D|nr:tannase/feruloyl esterase family alpha/beta hydrolase [Rahnella sp. PD12R]MBV6817849.1 tannase/feruloyl esterase family alpha/beta hydrolase [Rahnella sp. PD12R]
MKLKSLNGRWRALCLLPLLLAGYSSLSAAADPTAPAREVVRPVMSCAKLADVSLTDIGGEGSRITTAKEITVNGAPACEVDGNLHPEIGFQVILPVSSWQQRYMQIGCGGLCGNIQLQIGAAAGCTPLNTTGFVLAATDMGHSMKEGDFGKDPQKRVDFAYRSQHLTAEVSKKLITAFYGRAPAYSYFNGCSDGGREALMEAQRFPHDFNGIIAGAAAMNFQSQNAVYHAWQALSNTGPDGKPVLLAARLPLIHNAVLKQCDALDGQTDGLIADPQSCHFDTSVLACKTDPATPQGSCLSTAELTALNRLYAGPVDPKTGKKLIVGGPMPGSELAWEGVFVPEKASDPIFSQMIALSSLKYMNYEKNPPADFTLKDVKFTEAAFDELRKMHPLYDATNPDLTAFKAAGGKLIIWHGWADQHISPLNSVAYHQAVGNVMGAASRDQFERLYLLPGVHHCSGGEGPSLVDFLTPMMNWVEKGTAPDNITTYQAAKEQKTSFGQPLPERGKKPATEIRLEKIPADAASRPVFPYPDYAVYSGKGDVNSAASYVRKPLATQPAAYRWLGEDFYKPFTFMN